MAGRAISSCFVGAADVVRKVATRIIAAGTTRAVEEWSRPSHRPGRKTASDRVAQARERGLPERVSKTILVVDEENDASNRSQAGCDRAAAFPETRRQGLPLRVSETICTSMCETMSGHEHIHTSMASCVMPAEGEEEMRQLYLQMIVDSPEAILEELALPLKEALTASDTCSKSLLTGPRRDVVVAVNQEVATISKEAFSIGRMHSCDVLLDVLNTSVSRIQCWIFNFPGAIVVVDGWSLSGTALVNRETPGGEPLASLPHSRRAFMIPHSEAVTLQFGIHTEVTLNPKLCVVCLDRPRSVRLACGHQAFCLACAGQESEYLLTSCPICRADIQYGGIKMAVRAACAPSYVDPNQWAGHGSLPSSVTRRSLA
jgi:hypothetical protein